MIKRVMLLFLFLFLIQPASAQEDNFNNYSSLELSVLVESGIDVDLLKKTSKVEFLEVELAIFPREDERQKFISREIFSSPEAKVKDSDVIVFRWEDVKNNSLEYGINSVLFVDNDFKVVKEKIKFPISSLDSDIAQYKGFSEFIDIDDGIMSKAAEIVEGETDLYIATTKIAEWVRSNIEYNLTTLTADAVQKSTWTFKNKQGVCDELTNLFISMVRSIGIPARFVAGAVYTNTYYDFGNHGWAEVYFPGYGWIPFDVTFGQYGWIDPSHVKMIESFDYGKSNAIFYTWKSRDVEVSPSSLNVKTKVLSKNGKMKGFSKIDIKAIKTKVGFGSYAPVEFTIENLNDFYLPFSLIVKKGPKIFRGDNMFTVLKPREIKKVYWIFEIPDKLDENYIYKSTLEAETNFGESVSGEIEYSKFYEKYSLKSANSIVEKYKEISDKELFPDVDLRCEKGKGIYYEGEKVKIKCEVENKGNVNFYDLNACLYNSCRIFDLRIAEVKNIDFEQEASYSDNLEINLFSDDFKESENLELRVVKVPEVEIEYLGNKSLDYNKKGKITLKVDSNILIKNIALEINKKEFRLDQLKGTREIEIPMSGKEAGNIIGIKLKYEDETGREYESKIEEEILIVNVPWYVKILDFFGKLI